MAKIPNLKAIKDWCVSKFQPKGEYAEMTALNTHTADTAVHITAGERAGWDAAKAHADTAHAPADAGKNVQADWNETDTTSDAYIKNKPEIGAYPVTGVKGNAESTYREGQVNLTADDIGAFDKSKEINAAGIKVDDYYIADFKDGGFVVEIPEHVSPIIAVNKPVEIEKIIFGHKKAMFGMGKWIKENMAKDGAGNVIADTYAAKTEIPTKTSQLTNDSITAENIGAVPISGGTISGTTTINGITTSEPIHVISAEQYILMFDITDWYDSAIGQGVEKKGFIGTVFSNRTFGYTTPDGTAKLVISASYENKSNAVDGARLTLNIDDDRWMKPMVVRRVTESGETEEAETSYWLALAVNGLARNITFSGIFSGDFDGTVVKKDSGVITEVITDYTKSNIDCYGGRIADGSEILVSQQKANDTVDPAYGTLPFCGSPNVKTAFDTLHSKRSWIGSILDSNGTWHNLLSIRHRNGGGDGVSYGMYIRSIMTSKSKLVWRQQINGTWGDEKTLLDSDNVKTAVLHPAAVTTYLDEMFGKYKCEVTIDVDYSSISGRILSTSLTHLGNDGTESSGEAADSILLKTIGSLDGKIMQIKAYSKTYQTVRAKIQVLYISA